VRVSILIAYRHFADYTLFHQHLHAFEQSPLSIEGAGILE